MVFNHFCYYFWGQYCCWTETKILVTICLLFISFLFHQLYTASPVLLLFWRAWKKHKWKRSIATNKGQILKPMFPISYENAQCHQNPRQKVFNKGSLRLCRVVFNTSNWGTYRRVARGGAMRAIPPNPIPKVALTIFRLIKLLMCKPRKCISANQRNCLKKLFYFNF